MQRDDLLAAFGGLHHPDVAIQKQVKPLGVMALMKDLRPLIIPLGQRLIEDFADLAALQEAEGRQPGEKAFVELGQECTASLLKDKVVTPPLSHSGRRGNKPCGKKRETGFEGASLPPACRS